ncbi:hypothetical protein [Bacillus sp. EB600]|uniref:hypothetical protein n=1 Tax=Bacillus sp. EB600 TaxID=2806345 RepID=UPI00210E321B|nr:hypothetical protein [Bacillus sp. EB600]MCQ6280624.1 hypothetical protein [Bacillus sp. EB600]
MRKVQAPAQWENLNLLMEIHNLKITLRDIYTQKGSANSEYISLSIKLDLLMNEYIDEKLSNLMSISKHRRKENLQLADTVAPKRKVNYWSFFVNGFHN